MSKQTVVIFDSKPDDETLYIDEKPMSDAVAAEIDDGPLKGVWLFSSRKRAEEFCWKRGLEPQFQDCAALVASKED